ncbi:MAG: urease accessory UreF family protein, partial [Pseudomonadota bacterium]
MSLTLLTALQFGDAGFPSGGFAHSWGLETALRDGRLDRASLPAWMEAEICDRWAPFDRVALAGAWASSAGADWCETVDAAYWSETHRLRSLEAGASLLVAARRMGLAPLPSEAHLPIAQAAVFRAAGLDLETALAVSAHQAAQGMATAAVRLNLIGAVAVQAILRDLRPAVTQAASPPAADAHPASFAPLSDIALLRPHA